MPRIVVLDGFAANPGDVSWQPLEELGVLVVHDRTPPQLTLERARGADVLVTNKTRIDASVLDHAPALSGICVLATGVNVVDVAAAQARGVPVCNVPSYGAASVAEHTLALWLELARRVGLHDAAVHDGSWSASPDFSFWLSPQLELEGQRFGVVGYGAIGQRVARAALSLGARVVATPSRGNPPEPGVEVVDLDALFETSDVVSLHCPLTDATKEMVCWERLTRMKPTAFLINTARGGLISELDLARALHTGRIAGAALDVLAEEPPNPDNPLLTASRCIITPHLAWTTLASRGRLIRATADNVRALLSGSPQNLVRV